MYVDIPDTGLLCDLLWADPDKDIVGWGENDRGEPHLSRCLSASLSCLRDQPDVCIYVCMAGVSFTFGEDVVAQFLRRHDLDLICRAHQVRCCCR